MRQKPLKFGVVTGPSEEMARKQVLYAQERADGVELRFDLLEKVNLATLLEGISLLTLLTPATEEDLIYPFSYVDVSLEKAKTLIPLVREKFPSSKIICSFHDFTKTPDLEPIFDEMMKSGADLLKIACFANEESDAERMIEFAHEKQELGISLIGICMGEKGVKTRLTSLFDYRAIPFAKKVAPGQFFL